MITPEDLKSPDKQQQRRLKQTACQALDSRIGARSPNQDRVNDAASLIDQPLK
jgi:hypothetical protein